jgi:MFS family permease
MPKKNHPLYYGYIVVFAAVLIMTIVWGTNRTFGVFLKPMLVEFGWSRANISGAFTLAMIVMGLTGFLTGRITDRFGPRAIVMICGTCLGASYALTSMIQSAWQFYIVYGFLAGIGMSVTTALMSLVARWFVKRRALMSSILTAGPAFGNMMMPLVFSLIIHGVGWRQSYLIMAGIVLFVVFSTIMFLKRDPSQMGLVPYGVENKAAPDDTLQSEGLSVASALRTKQYWLISFLFFCDFFLFNVVSVHIVIHAMDIGIPATEAASILSVASGVCLFARIIIGGIADKVGCKPTFMVCLIMAIVGFALLLVAQSLWTLYLFAAIFGFGLWASGGLIPPMTAELFGLRDHGTIYGSIFVSGATGGAFGPVVVGYLFDLTGDYQLAFIVCFIITILSLLSLMGLKPIKESDHKA